MIASISKDISYQSLEGYFFPNFQAEINDLAKEAVMQQLEFYFRTPTKSNLQRRYFQIINCAHHADEMLGCPIDRKEFFYIAHYQDSKLSSEQIERVSIWLTGLIRERALENVAQLLQVCA